MLYTLGGTFYTFQWDILLLETGYLTALCFAPWQSLRLNDVGSVDDNNQKQIGCKESDTLGAWPLRFLLFKLMLMSGVVKIQADCPTWKNLTALEYHFATQCLPGPFAWHAHQLHPLILRLGVAATFVIEIPAAFLLVFPMTTVRRVGAWLQILLQVLIIGTGNYNFFNLLTIALCLPCIIGGGNVKTRNKLQLQVMQVVSCVVFLAWSCKMFEIYNEQHPIHHERQVIGLRLALSKYDCNTLMEKTVPVCCVSVVAFTILGGVHLMAKETSTKRHLGLLINTLVCSYCVIATAEPLFGLTRSMKQPILFERILQAVPHGNIMSPSGYGLFRRMTGLGRVPTSGSGESYGWAGVSPSVVARPEIITEAVIEDAKHNEEHVTINTENEELWQELNFRWKPGNITHWPSQVAPHQPRFDWRMWFAALGSYQHNPWLVSFLDKLLDGCPVVIDLLDEPELLSGERRIKKVRASLYEYDFTRLDTDWSCGIPGATILQNEHFWGFPTQVWTRKFVRSYLPPIDKNILRLNGFEDRTCIAQKNRCSDVPTKAKAPCQVAAWIRGWNRPCLLSVLVLAFCLRRGCWRSSKLVARSAGPPKVKEVKAD